MSACLDTYMHSTPPLQITHQCTFRTFVILSRFLEYLTELRTTPVTKDTASYWITKDADERGQQNSSRTVEGILKKAPSAASFDLGVDFMEGGKPENPEKNPRSKGEVNYNSSIFFIYLQLYVTYLTLYLIFCK